MKIVIAGDLHLTESCPENRTDDYQKTVLRKFQFVLNMVKKQKADFLILPGDIFDSPNPPYSLFTKVVSQINDIGITIVGCHGQHDLKFRNKDTVALQALRAACPKVYIDFNGILDGINIQSVSYGEDINPFKKGSYNILVIHKMIVQKKLWEDQTDFIYSNKFLMDNKFDLICSGDNHQFFIDSMEDRLLVNCGSMLRSNITQIKHIPIIVLFETSSGEYEKIPIPVEPAEKVFAMEKVGERKDRDKKLDAFVSGLSNNEEMDLNFENNLESYIRKNKIEEDIRYIIKENMV